MTTVSQRAGQLLRAARQQAGLRLEDISGYSPSHLSRVERGLAEVTPDITRQYVDATGDSALLSQSSSQSKPSEGTRRRAPQFETAFAVDSLDVTVRIRPDRVLVSEQRVIRAVGADLERVRIHQGLPAVEGRVARLVSVEAVRAHLDETVWLSDHYLGLDLSFAHLVPAGAEHRFTLEYEFDFLYPAYIFTPLVEASELSITVQLPHSGSYTVFDIDGLAPTAMFDLRAAALAGRPSALDVLDVDRFGVVSRTYKGLYSGLSYGIIWREDTAMEPEQ